VGQKSTAVPQAELAVVVMEIPVAEETVPLILEVAVVLVMVGPEHQAAEVAQVDRVSLLFDIQTHLQQLTQLVHQI
jgi:hypothetical protein